MTKLGKQWGRTWTQNARRAMTKQPDYFVWWYTVKSVGLVAALGAAAYFAGKARGVNTRSGGA